jgi:DNA gyrase/topoisomerase IV subunit B
MRKEEWLFDITKVSITKGFIELPQAIERLFIEILSNASDNAHRSRRTGINPDKIEVTMNERVITIKNYGIPIPIDIHPI